MQIQDESYIKWKLFLEGNDEAYSWLYTHSSMFNRLSFG